jgi:hypothetical protein
MRKCMPKAGRTSLALHHSLLFRRDSSSKLIAVGKPIMKADPFNIAIVFLVFMNTLAAVQFQALARTTSLRMSALSTIEDARGHILTAVGY